MSRHYDIVRLRAGEGIEVGTASVTVDLDKITPKDVIQNDDEFNSSLQPEHYFYVSGGGSFLFRGRYLLTVRRPLTARVHPGKLSIFTGRAEGLHEWREPWRVVRELFEEVVLFEGRKIFYPRFPPYQEIIDEVYRTHFTDKFSRDFAYADIKLEAVPLGERILRVVSEGCSSEYRLSYHINSKNDINVLSLFAVDLDPHEIRVLDAEDLNSSREICLLDIETGDVMVVGQGSANQWQVVEPGDMTEHLSAMLGLITRKLPGEVCVS
jgi:hypothetical protein